MKNLPTQTAPKLCPTEVRAFSLQAGTLLYTSRSADVSSEELSAAGVIDENGKHIRNPARNSKTLEQGASTSICCATRPRLDGMDGAYCGNPDIPILASADPTTFSKLGDSLLHQRVMPYTFDPKSVERP